MPAQHRERSINGALSLLVGWLYILSAVGLLLFEGRDGISTALCAFMIGTACTLRVYYQDPK